MMSYDYAVSLNGIHAAERDLSLASHRIAAGGFPDPADNVEVLEAKTTIEANLHVISTQIELDRESLDLFA